MRVFGERERERERERELVVQLVWFYGISTFVGYLIPNPFLYKSVLFQTIPFSMSTQYKC